MAKESSDFISANNEYVFNTYGRTPIMLVEGKGVRVKDSEGKEYLDFVQGIAACPLGHAHPVLVDAISRQAARLIHVSNIFHIQPQIELARLLTENSFADKAFFCNSGAEANEGAIKLSRKFFNDSGAKDRFHIITMENSFHGRTLATLAATGQTKYRQGFEPHTPGFSHVPFGDFEALEAAVSDNTAAVMIEPIQGEGGVRIPPPDFLRKVRELCDNRGVLLVFDEVQTGMGRTGKLFAYENFGVAPDIMTLAKGLAGGVPIGALLATDRIAETFKPGNHATTFGGNPLSSAAGVAVVREILSPGFLDRVRIMGGYLRSRLEDVAAKHKVVKEVRGMGLMQAMDLKIAGADLVTIMRENGLLVNCTSDTVLRFLPPLIVSGEEIDEMIIILEASLSRITD
ncbi:MAG: acetylornithine transaminase [Desulfomonilaceae bacterium]|jgi:predicted acetylornithine/succinylornithine family transaminase